MTKPGLLILLFAGLLPLAANVAVADQGKPPVVDVHLHYNFNQTGVTTPKEAVRALEQNHVIFGVVSSTPPEHALLLQRAGGKRIIPIFRPYLDPGKRHSWFNDPRAVPETDKALSSGQYHGIGELHMIAGLGATHKNTVLNGLVKLGIKYDVPILVHTETSSHKYFLPLCQRYPRARFLWAHAGSRLDASEVGSLMGKCRNVWVEFSSRDPWRYIEDPIVDDKGRLLAGWLALVKQYPHRFMIGADPIWPVDNLHSWDEPDTGWHRYTEFLEFHRSWLGHLPPGLAQRLRVTNAMEFFRIE